MTPITSFPSPNRIKRAVAWIAALAAIAPSVWATAVVADPAMAAQPMQTPLTHHDIDVWADAWNSHDIDKVLSLFTPDVVIHQPSNPKPLDFGGTRGFFSMIFKAYPDFHVAVTDALVDGNQGVSVERVTGTWTGPYTDPATGKTTPGNGRAFDHPGVMILTYSPDHHIRQVDIYWDRLVVNQQLGLSGG